MNEELNKKLAEFAGINLVGVPEGCGPHFTESFDACVKRLLPKMDWQQIIFQPDGYCGITVNDELYEAEADEKLALALCLAIEKMVRNEG